MKLIFRRDSRIPEFVFIQFESGKTLRTEDVLLVTIMCLVAAMLLLLISDSWWALLPAGLGIGLFLATIFRKPWVDPRYALEKA